MNKEELQELYKVFILPESKKPYRYGLGTGLYEIKAYNPFCGDAYTIKLDLTSKVQNITFTGTGCALSKASTSLLIREIDNQDIKKSLDIIEAFLNQIDDVKSGHDPEKMELSILHQITHFDGRKDCIKLSWIALLSYLKAYKNAN